MNTDSIIKIIEILKRTYPDAKCSLDFSTPFQLVISVMLSAQCTDERVNKITPYLFSSYSTPSDFAKIELSELEKLIHSCGFYKNKAKNIKACAKKIITDFSGEVPYTMEELLTLPGVGRKSANVILLEAFNKPCGIAVDTHAKRISNRLGLSSNSNPEKIEQDLLRQIPQEYFKDINHLFIFHGRNICSSQNPKCEKCTIHSKCLTYLSSHKV